MASNSQVSSNISSTIFNGTSSGFDNNVRKIVFRLRLTKHSYVDKTFGQDSAPTAKKVHRRPLGFKNKLKKDSEDISIGKRVYQNKAVFPFSMIITMALLNSPEENATVQMMYAFVAYHFPSKTIRASWKSSLRHALSHSHGFEKSIQHRFFFWKMIPSRRDELIREVITRAEEYKKNTEALMIRDYNELPAILAGKSVLPLGARVYKETSIHTVKPRPASLQELNEVLKATKIRLELNIKPLEPTPSDGYWLYYTPNPRYAHE